MGRKQRRKIVLGPELPPEPSEDEIIVSDEDLQFVTKNRDYTGFVSSLDTESISRHVSRIAHANEDALEALYEERLKKKSKEMHKANQGLEVYSVDALPVKTLDGKVYYRKSVESSKESAVVPEDATKMNVDEVADVGDCTRKPTKAERRNDLKKSKKMAKRLAKDSGQPEENPQARVLASVREDISAEEAVERKKLRLAELGMTLLSDPESNIKNIKEMFQLCKDEDDIIAKLGLLSLLAVYKDIIPGYRIRLPTDKEQGVIVSKEVKKIRFYESTLLLAYKAYLQRLIQLENQSKFFHVSVRCICALVEAVPHFNFRESLLRVVVKNMNSRDDEVRKLCCAAVKSIFLNDGKHRGEASLQAIHMIAESVKSLDCQLHPDSIEAFLSLAFDEDLCKHVISENKSKQMGNKRKRQKDEKVMAKQEEMLKTRAGVNSDYNAAALTPNVMERRQTQTEIFSAVFLTYFRILKHAVHSLSCESSGSVNRCPLLPQCLNGIGKFSHLLDLDFMGDLMSYLKCLASASGKPASCITVADRLQCCIIAFKVMRNNFDALNVDLNDFFVQLYNLVLEFRPGRDKNEVLAEALKLMLCGDRQSNVHRAAAFIKRLVTFSLCVRTVESVPAMAAAKNLLQRNAKCRSLLENESGGGSVSGSFCKYQPFVSDPNLSGALATSLWELSLLSRHYDPAVSSMASAFVSS